MMRDNGGRLFARSRRMGIAAFLLLSVLSGQVASGPLVRTLEQDRARLLSMLQRQGVVHPARRVSHLSYVCALNVQGRSMAVLDLREIISGAAVPKGYNRILVVDSNGRVATGISYATERPLVCRGRRLLVQGSLAMDNLGPGGNVLVFDHRGRPVRTEQVDAQVLWPPP